jgi:hypothetical protein
MPALFISRFRQSVLLDTSLAAAATELSQPGVPLPFSHELLDRLEGACGVEIYNGCLSRRAYQGVPFGLGLGVDFWDSQLGKGKILWGFGNDDAHEPYEIHVGWTEIYAPANAFGDLHTAVKRGCLCCCRGLRLESFELNGASVRIKAGYTWQPCENALYRFIGCEGKELASCRGAWGEYELKDEQYVRVEVAAPDGSMLWTQPLLNVKSYDVSKIGI